jgi:hypothetical protein
VLQAAVLINVSVVARWLGAQSVWSGNNSN